MALSLSVEEGAMAVYVGGQYSRHQVAPAIYLRCQPMRTSPLAAGKAPTSSPLLSPPLSPHPIFWGCCFLNRSVFYHFLVAAFESSPI